jgi:GTPase involved in cell partitioning and DNA repair
MNLYDGPVQYYRTLMKELCMYNIDYLECSDLVVLNKLDLLEAKERFDFLSK